MSKHYTFTGALVSPCGLYRYRLWRRWSDKPVLIFIMLNPSTADGEQDDPTIRKCVGFADRMGYGGIEILNLFAYRATKPADLKAAGYLVGPDNDSHIKATLNIYHDVICAWGVNAATAQGWARVKQVMEIVDGIGIEADALRLTANGIPWHPLMLPYACEPIPFDLRNQVAA